MSFTQDLAVGFAHLLAGAGAGLTWSDTATYTNGQTGIYIADAPPLVDRLVVVTPYPLTADPTLASSTYGVQFRSRGARDAGAYDVWLLDDAIRKALLGNFPLQLDTGIYVASLVYANGGSLGVDEQSRWNWQSSFTANVKDPSDHR